MIKAPVFNFMRKHNSLNMKLNHGTFHTAKCPCCDSSIRFWETDISVNCETKGHYEIPGMLQLTRPCENPL